MNASRGAELASHQCVNACRRHEYLYQYITKNTAQAWANNFLAELNNIQPCQFTEGVHVDHVDRDLPEPLTTVRAPERERASEQCVQDKKKTLFRSYRRGKKCLIVLGLNECLLSFKQFKTREALVCIAPRYSTVYTALCTVHCMV